MKPSLRGLVWGLLGFLLFLAAVEISRRIPGSPVARSMRLVTAVLQQQPAPQRVPGEVTFEASRWYEGLALPAVVGIVEGLLLGFFRRLNLLEALIAGLAFGLLVFSFVGKLPPGDLVSWGGPVFFVFSLAGGASFVADFRQPAASPS